MGGLTACNEASGGHLELKESRKRRHDVNGKQVNSGTTRPDTYLFIYLLTYLL